MSQLHKQNHRIHNTKAECRTVEHNCNQACGFCIKYIHDIYIFRGFAHITDTECYLAQKLCWRCTKCKAMCKAKYLYDKSRMGPSVSILLNRIKASPLLHKRGQTRTQNELSPEVRKAFEIGPGSLERVSHA